MQKAALRKIYKEKRAAFSKQQYDLQNDMLLLQFKKSNFPFIHSVFSYFPIGHFMEPETFFITRYLKNINPQIQIAYPKMHSDNTMMAIIATEDSEFAINSFGINELQEGAILHPKDIDMVIVPMLVCDKKGYRVGYGKGFYDKYLTSCKKDVLKIGLSFFDPVDTIEDVEQFDVPLTHCITPETVYEF
jgi:5-formyltetrahydrofolate cyclo-ligase